MRSGQRDRGCRSGNGACADAGTDRACGRGGDRRIRGRNARADIPADAERVLAALTGLTAELDALRTRGTEILEELKQ